MNLIECFLVIKYMNFNEGQSINMILYTIYIYLISPCKLISGSNT